ncbi:MAG: ATP-binding protein [Oscillospiraceae bacterium]
MKSLNEIKTDFMELSLPIGLLIVKATPKLEILFANEMFAKMLKFDSTDELLNIYGKSSWEFIYKDDFERLRKASSERKGRFEPYEIRYRVVRKDGSLIWVNQNSRHTYDENGNEIIFAYYTDITSNTKTEYALRESEFRYATAIKASNINIWEYSYLADTMTIFSTSPKVNPKDLIIPNYLHSVVEENHIRSDSAPLLFNMINRLKNGEKEISADLWIRENENDDFWCERVTYTNIFDDNDKPVKAYCIGHDVTREKEAEKRYLDELSYREAMQKATMASINVNLTKNVILDYKSNFPEVVAHMNAAKSAQEYFERLYTEISTDEMRKNCMEVFNCDALLKQFADGKTTLSMELTRKIEGRRYWTVLTVHMMKKPESNEIVAFLYSTNVTTERTMQNVMNAIVKTDYDFLVVVDAIRNSAVRYSENNYGQAYAFESENFEEETHEYIRNYICPVDIKRVLHEFTIKNITNELDKNKTYSIFYTVPNPSGGVFQKQLRFCYINSELKSFLMTRVDITDAVIEQKRQNDELVAAVKMAEQANAAKSEFLSRISHEIRTPINAIMGMDQLALQRLEDKDFVKECINKSQYASNYLLLLINDILDMSKIESGKITLQNDIIYCKKFLDSIDTIVGTQARAKGVNFNIKGFDGSKTRYWGDGVRLQQILINVLSNAIKFTPSGGNVSLDISKINSDETKTTVCFKITDTGIGISEKFLPNIFNPFSQEHNSSTSGYGGSGLGLAISKNLAQLMGGNIEVESVVDKGTTFRVNIPLAFVSDLEQSAEEQHLPEEIESYDFTGKRILLIEDHELNIIVAKKLLEFKNAIVDVAVNGKIGLDMFSSSEEYTYDAILMDIRMPVMDGLEAAKSIRNLDKEWAKLVPIIAMSANAFDEDVIKSKEAGMNAHLAKPVNSKLLYKTLSNLFVK